MFPKDPDRTGRWRDSTSVILRNSAADADRSSAFFGNCRSLSPLVHPGDRNVRGDEPRGAARPADGARGRFSDRAGEPDPRRRRQDRLHPHRRVARLSPSAPTSKGASCLSGSYSWPTCFFLDILPQSFLQPLPLGRRLNAILLLFAYHLLGPILFGWYGIFLMPILFVLARSDPNSFPFCRGALSGEPIRPEASVAEDIGTDPGGGARRARRFSGRFRS